MWGAWDSGESAKAGRSLRLQPRREVIKTESGTMVKRGGTRWRGKPVTGLVWGGRCQDDAFLAWLVWVGCLSQRWKHLSLVRGRSGGP